MTRRTRFRNEDDRVPADARRKLLAATEALLLDEGMTAISTRVICGAAQTNVSQIRYYFGSLGGLIDAVLAAELDSVTRAYEAANPSGEYQDLGGLVDLLLDSVRAPAAFSEDGFAALVIESIYRHTSAASQGAAAERLARSQKPFLKTLSAFLPHLAPDALHYRFSATIAMVMAMLPQASGSRLFAIQQPRAASRHAWCDTQLKALCLAALAGDKVHSTAVLAKLRPSPL